MRIPPTDFGSYDYRKNISNAKDAKYPAKGRKGFPLGSSAKPSASFAFKSQPGLLLNLAGDNAYLRRLQRRQDFDICRLAINDDPAVRIGGKALDCSYQTLNRRGGEALEIARFGTFG